MKHKINVSVILIILFLLSQFIGLFIINSYFNAAEGNFEPIFVAGVELERPEVDANVSFVYIVMAILIGTGIAFLLIFFKVWNLWRVWFFLAVSLALTIAFAPILRFILPLITEEIISVVGFIIAVILGYFKVFKRNFIVHNLTELFVYGGIAAIFVPVMSLFSAFGLLVLISIYDAWAVWKSKHMIKLAKAQSKSKVFAGLFVPYELPKKIPKGAKVKKKAVKNAVLGGGDIGFCLLFTGTVLYTVGFVNAMIVPIFSTAALGFLLFLSKKDKFYPAMPFLTTGCLVGFLVSLLF